MENVRLDPKKMLGFRIERTENGAVLRAKVGNKDGAKPASVLSAKVGAKPRRET